MKEFRKSVVVKTMNYILHILAVITFAGSIVLEAVFVDLGFYDLAPETIYDYIMRVYAYTPEDKQMVWDLICLGHDIRYWVFGITVAAFIIAISTIVSLVLSAGYKRGSDELNVNVIDRIPADIYAVIVFTIYCIFIAIGLDVADYIRLDYTYVFEWFVVIACCFMCIVLEPAVVMGIAVRIKDKSLFKNTICYKLINLVWKALKWLGNKLSNLGKMLWTLILNLPLFWRTAVSLGAVVFVEFIVIMFAGAFSSGREFAAVLIVMWFVQTIILVPLVLFGAYTLRELEKAGEKLAGGDLDYKLNLKGLFWIFRKHGENLNSISDGMRNAVFKELKSERMKTELITNVSHDIKTPLTSLINYATLISEEECDNEKIKEYSEVLVRQSDRLRRLIEDLVEASKASTGNIEVELVPCDPSIFITQADGEYADKLASGNLTLVTKVPEENVKIMADGRRMWRVFDNLMNNIYKYALPGTRVYLALDIVGNKAVFTFKNTSKDMLDISEEELMERFVRGDKSRNTEGNGLGLSIAKSMAEVQKGTLDITIDGDLFKATLAFPVIEEE